MLIHPLAERLRALGLAAMADTFLQMQLDPAAAELSREDWLGLLLEREVTARDNKRLSRRLSQARCGPSGPAASCRGVARRRRRTRQCLPNWQTSRARARPFGKVSLTWNTLK